MFLHLNVGNCLLSILGFLGGGTTDIWCRIILVIEGREGCPEHCRMFSSTLRLYLLNASGSPLYVMTTQSFLIHYQKSPREKGSKVTPGWGDLSIPLDNFPFLNVSGHANVLLHNCISVYLLQQCLFLFPNLRKLLQKLIVQKKCPWMRGFVCKWGPSVAPMKVTIVAVWWKSASHPLKVTTESNFSWYLESKSRLYLCSSVH